MRSFFQFTRGEWAATLIIALLTSTSFLFSSLPHHGAKHFDLSLFQEEIDRFILEQEMIKDSVALAAELKKGSINRFTSFSKNRNSRDSSTYSYPDFKKQEYKPLYTITWVDINSCDTSDIVKIPRFGSKRALRLVEYRELLGGFCRLEQFLEVYSLQDFDTAFLARYFYIDNQKIRLIKINEADYKTLISHPYFDAYLTKSILHYRQKNGRVNSLDEFHQATNAYPELLEKIGPYLSFE